MDERVGTSRLLGYQEQIELDFSTAYFYTIYKGRLAGHFKTSHTMLMRHCVGPASWPKHVNLLR